MCARVIKSQEFWMPSADLAITIESEMRLLRQLDLTNASERASLSSVQMDWIISNLSSQPSPASPFSRVYFAAFAILSINNIYFRFMSSHFFEAFVKQSIGFFQGIPSRAHFQSCRDQLAMQFAGLSSFLTITSIPINVAIFSLILEPHIDERR